MGSFLSGVLNFDFALSLSDIFLEGDVGLLVLVGVANVEALPHFGFDSVLLEPLKAEPTKPMHRVSHSESPKGQEIAQGSVPGHGRIDHLHINRVNNVNTQIQQAEHHSTDEVSLGKTECIVYCVNYKH